MVIIVFCGKLYEVFEKSVKFINLNLLMDLIIEVRVRDNLLLQYIKVENIEMEINEIVEILGCKFIEYIILLIILCNYVVVFNYIVCVNFVRNIINVFLY